MRLVSEDGDGEDVSAFSGDEILNLEPAFVTSRMIDEVQLENRPDDSRHIVLYLSALGRERLARITREHTGRRMAIVVGGRFVVAPTIRTEISNGIAHVTVRGDIEQVFEAMTGGGDGEAEPETEDEPEVETEVVAEAEVVAEPETETEAGTETEAETEPEIEADPEVEAETEPTNDEAVAEDDETL